MSWFTRWRQSDVLDFSDAIRPELQALPTPVAGEALLERILASRAAGDRAILPNVRAPRRRGALRCVIPLAVAAALLMLLMPGERMLIRRRTDGITGPEPVANAPFLSGVAYAQEMRVADHPSLSPLRIAAARQLRSTSVEYSRVWRDSAGKIVNDMHGRVTLSLDTVGGADAWKLVSDDRGIRDGHGQVESETVYVARNDLRFLSRQVHVAPYLKYEGINVRQQFRGDSVTGTMTIPSRGISRPIARLLPRSFGPYITDTFAPFALMGLPLQPRWSASVSVVGWALVPRDVFIPIELRVVGEEFVRVPAGRFDCWRLSVRFFAKEMSYWVRKSDGLGVRSLDESDAGAGVTREVVLLREK